MATCPDTASETTATRAVVNHTVLAGAAIVLYAAIIGFTDNYVRLVAVTHGLWQFHAARTFMAFAIVAAAAPFLGLEPRPKRWGGVVARSLLQGFAVLLYFGCLAFLPVAVAAAGLFTAPIFVLLISRVAFGRHIGPFRILAVGIGFVGSVLVLGPQGGAGVSVAAVLPVAAAVLYALGSIATREWCEGESTTTLTLGFFAALGAFGVAGLAVLAIWQPDVPAGTEGFALRGWVAPSQTFLLLTLLQAAGSLVAIGLMVRAYQIAEASRVAIFEYATLPASAFWTWALWGEVLSFRALAGMALIVAAGAIVALRGR
ncbi:DMT family transporter [Defluviimonas sp. SAOS-178_SWC]|uniref:DMT family transporter n=1 Tax=Defluviimonas sp. SAOS-178_SWC TaxID=3121287 RepID=UPI0032214A04